MLQRILIRTAAWSAFYVFSAGVLGLGLLAGCETARDALAEQAPQRSQTPPRPNSGNLDQHTNAAVIAWVSEHPTWSQGWAELTRRMKAGVLSDAEARQGLDILIACLEKQAPTGNPIAFSRADFFVAEVYEAGLIDDATLRAYAKAFIGEAFQLNDASAASGDRFMPVRVRFGTNVEEMQGSGLPYRLIWQVREVRLDGEVIKPSRVEYPLTSVAIILDPKDYEIGAHRLEVVMEAGLALREEAPGFNQRFTAPDDWPQTRLRWRVSQDANIRIEQASAAR